MFRFILLLVVIIHFTTLTTALASTPTVTNFTLNTDLNKADINFAIPKNWEVKRNINNSYLVLQKNKSWIKIQILDNKEENSIINCYNFLKLDIIDSKIYIKESLINNIKEVFISNSNFENLKFNYIPLENNKVNYYELVGNNYLKKDYKPKTNCKVALLKTEVNGSNISNNLNYSITFISDNLTDKDEQLDIFKSLNLNNLATPDKENQISPIQAIESKVLETPRGNILIFCGFFLLLLMFCIFLVIMTRIKR